MSWLRAWALESQRLGFKFQLCYLLALPSTGSGRLGKLHDFPLPAFLFLRNEDDRTYFPGMSREFNEMIPIKDMIIKVVITDNFY